MAEKLAPNELVTIEEMVPARMFEQEALVNPLDRKWLVRKAEVLEEVKRLKERAAKAQ